MRQTLANYLNELKNDDIYLLHDDLYHFDCYNSINCGIIEPTIVTIASGLARCNKKVIIYSVAGFTLYRAFDQIKYYLCPLQSLPYGNVVFCNAGGGHCVNVYPLYMGESHRIRDDDKLCNLLNIPLFEPYSSNEFIEILNNSLNSNSQKVSFIRLGFDYE